MAYVFVASTGRCGTKFMSAVWRYFTEYPSLHEPVPFCVGQTMREVNNECGINSTTKEELRTKLDQIRTDSKNGKYFESNQAFIKTYVHLIAYEKDFRPLYVIYLHRNPIEVAMSYCKKNPKADLSWHLQPQWQKNILRAQKGLSHHEISIWQWYEIRARFLLWKDKFDKSYDFDFRKISDIDEYRKLFSHLEIEHKLPEKFPPDFFHPRKTMNQIEMSEEKVFKTMMETWDVRGVDTTKSAQDNFFALVKRRIEQQQLLKGDNNEAQ